MKPKYTYEKLDGTLVYPDCPETIKSKEDLQRWFEHTGQITENINDKKHLLEILPAHLIKEQTADCIKIMFPRCKFHAYAKFTGNECFAISL